LIGFIKIIKSNSDLSFLYISYNTLGFDFRLAIIVQDERQLQIISSLQIRDISCFETQTRQGKVAYFNMSYFWRFLLSFMESPFEVYRLARMYPLIKPNMIDVFALAANLDIVIHSKTYRIYGFFLSTLRADNLTPFRAIHFYFLDFHMQQKPRIEVCLSNYPLILAHPTGVALPSSRVKDPCNFYIPASCGLPEPRRPLLTREGARLPSGTRGTAY
jgi:hypothetical protein